MDDVRRPLRILHCPTNVGSNPQGLARAERELGLESSAVAFRSHRFQTPPDEVLWQPSDGRIRCEIRRWQLLRRALRDFDVVHFNFGSSILPERMPWHDPWMQSQPWPLRVAYALYAGLFEQRDLRWLKRAGIGIVATYQGDDARQGDYSRDHFETSIAGEVEPGYYTDAKDRDIRRRIARVAHLADQVYALNPDLLHVLPAGAEFLPYAHVDSREWQPAEQTPGRNERPVILHAPTHRGVKGTGHLLAAVERLQSEDGLDFEFVLIENMPYEEACRQYRRADLLVDQLLCGWYGGLALELMALGKPVICYLRESDLSFLPSEMRADLPIINADPRTIYPVLRSWLTDRRGELAERGQRSRHYIETWHDPRTIAERLQQRYRDILAGKARDKTPGVAVRSNTL